MTTDEAKEKIRKLLRTAKDAEERATRGERTAAHEAEVARRRATELQLKFSIQVDEADIDGDYRRTVGGADSDFWREQLMFAAASPHNCRVERIPARRIVIVCGLRENVVRSFEAYRRAEIAVAHAAAKSWTTYCRANRAHHAALEAARLQFADSSQRLAQRLPLVQTNAIVRYDYGAIVRLPLVEEILRDAAPLWLRVFRTAITAALCRAVKKRPANPKPDNEETIDVGNQRVDVIKNETDELTKMIVDLSAIYGHEVIEKIVTHAERTAIAAAREIDLSGDQPQALLPAFSTVIPPARRLAGKPKLASAKAPRGA